MDRFYILYVHDAARAEDRQHFRRSREARFHGAMLETITPERRSRLPELLEAFAPMRAHLATRDFLGGAPPSCADYIALSLFQWLAGIATLPPLAADDHVLREWIDQGCNLYAGLGRDPRIRPPFEQAWPVLTGVTRPARGQAATPLAQAARTSWADPPAKRGANCGGTLDRPVRPRWRPRGVDAAAASPGRRVRPPGEQARPATGADG